MIDFGEGLHFDSFKLMNDEYFSVTWRDVKNDNDAYKLSNDTGFSEGIEWIIDISSERNDLYI